MDGYIPAYPAENPFARNSSPVVERFTVTFQPSRENGKNDGTIATPVSVARPANSLTIHSSKAAAFYPTAWGTGDDDDVLHYLDDHT